jgi:hypothetical protein
VSRGGRGLWSVPNLRWNQFASYFEIKFKPLEKFYESVGIVTEL